MMLRQEEAEKPQGNDLEDNVLIDSDSNGRTKIDPSSSRIYGTVNGRLLSVGVGDKEEDHTMVKGCMHKMFPEPILPELKQLLQLAWPMVLTQLCQFLIGPVALIFCGHLGKTQLDAVALANSLINVTVMSVAVGMASACDTLFSQVYGSNNWRKLGIVLQRSIIIMICLGSLPCLAIHLNTEHLLLLFGQDASVSRLTGRYMMYLIPGVVSYFLYISLSKYLQNQNVVMPNLVIGGITNGINALLHYILVYAMELGTDGSAISQSFSYFSMFLLTFLYIWKSGIYKSTWEGWSMESLQEWGTFFRLAIFGLIMICIEWWSFEAGVFLAGILGKTQLGVQSVCFQIEIISYMLPLGVGISASIRVGQCLGGGRLAAAKTAAWVAISFIVIITSFAALPFAVFRQYWPRIFTNVPEVVNYAASLMPILALYMVMDGITGVCAGILRGSGRQHVGALLIFICYFMSLSAGIPIMFLTSMELRGLWWSFAGALFIQSVLALVAIGLTDWQQQVSIARTRTNSTIPDDPTDIPATSGHDYQALIGNRDSCIGSTEDVQEDGAWSNKHLTGSQLLWRRLVVVLVAVCVLITGIICRILFETGAIHIQVTNSTAPYTYGIGHMRRRGHHKDL